MFTNESLYSFPGNNRLKKADEFSSVFIFRKVLYGKYYKIHYKPTSIGVSRLGLIVAKRVHKRANKRNYMKRVLRELFRQQKCSWGAYDIIVQVQKCFVADNYSEIKDDFIKLTKRLAKNNDKKNNSPADSVLSTCDKPIFG